MYSNSTLAPKYLNRYYFKANVYIIWVHGPLGLGGGDVLIDAGSALRLRTELRCLTHSVIHDRSKPKRSMYLYVCMYVCMYMYVYVCMYMYVYVCICMYVCMYVRTSS